MNIVTHPLPADINTVVGLVFNGAKEKEKI